MFSMFSRKKNMQNQKLDEMKGFTRASSILEISKAQFESFNINRVEISPEQQWFQDKNENVIGTIIYDSDDKCYGFVILGRDVDGEFKYISGNMTVDKTSSAEHEITSKMQMIVETKLTVFPQDDIGPWHNLVK